MHHSLVRSSTVGGYSRLDSETVDQVFADCAECRAQAKDEAAAAAALSAAAAAALGLELGARTSEAAVLRSQMRCHHPETDLN